MDGAHLRAVVVVSVCVLERLGERERRVCRVWLRFVVLCLIRWMGVWLL